ncbi:MAG: hypothetical protein ACYSW2_16565, partial [Planctomycetota bacterium]
MTNAQTIWQRYRRLPRAGQWAIAAGVGVVLLIIWNDYVLSQAADWNEQADELLADAREAAGGERRLAR